tara:strand:- start:5765 stop:6808 length:1044 start_codon:yes stop_codon:yes gene_type:complete
MRKRYDLEHVTVTTRVDMVTVDRVLLDQLYRSRLMTLREVAESNDLAKNGSVEVLRARLIRHLVLSGEDLSWEGIQALNHEELGAILKIFGIKSSGSHKERRQRLWLHLNFDSRRMRVEYLAEMEREKLHELCQKLELPLTGTRTVLMGRVSGVLNSQGRGWGQIKKSLKRNGLSDIDSSDRGEIISKKDQEEIVIIDVSDEKIDFLEPLPLHVLEDARDTLISGISNLDNRDSDDLKKISERIDDLERMIGTILNGHGGRWSEIEEDLLIRLAERRGWPMIQESVRTRVLLVASRLAEEKGCSAFTSQKNESDKTDQVYRILNSSEAMERIRSKMTEAEQILTGLR